ncbi:MAG: hypothetical protein HY667_00505 [Chloroflexi bacterium]|nr:hypothetical protein [Chloroflexota bacterium]
MTTERRRFRRRPPLRPFRELEEMRRRFEDEVTRPFMRAIWERIPEEDRGWSPAIDLYEKGDTFIVKAELPRHEAGRYRRGGCRRDADHQG